MAAASETNRKLSAEQMATKQRVRRMNEERIACFDAGNLGGCVVDFVKECRFVVVAPGSDDIIFTGIDDVREAEAGFLEAVKQSFSGSFHELCEWRWIDICADVCEVHVLNK